MNLDEIKKCTECKADFKEADTIFLNEADKPFCGKHMPFPIKREITKTIKEDIIRNNNGEF